MRSGETKPEKGDHYRAETRETSSGARMRNINVILAWSVVECSALTGRRRDHVRGVTGSGCRNVGQEMLDYILIFASAIGWFADF